MALSDAKPYAVAHWALDETSGTRYDTVGSNDLADNNTVLSGTGIFGTAADFERDNSEYLSIADNADLSMGDIDFCISCWVKPESSGANGVVWSKWNYSALQREYFLQHTSGNRFVFGVSPNGTGNTQVTANTFGAISPGSTYLVVCWHNAGSNEIGISVNGVADTASHSTGVFNGTSPFRVGNMVIEYFDGLIEDLTVLKSYVLSSTEITELYNSGTGVAFADWDAAHTPSCASGAVVVSGAPSGWTDLEGYYPWNASTQRYEKGSDYWEIDPENLPGVWNLFLASYSTIFPAYASVVSDVYTEGPELGTVSEVFGDTPVPTVSCFVAAGLPKLLEGRMFAGGLMSLSGGLG